MPCRGVGKALPRMPRPHTLRLDLSVTYGLFWNLKSYTDALVTELDHCDKDLPYNPEPPYFFLRQLSCRSIASDWATR